MVWGWGGRFQLLLPSSVSLLEGAQEAKTKVPSPPEHQHWRWGQLGANPLPAPDSHPP